MIHGSVPPRMACRPVWERGAGSRHGPASAVVDLWCGASGLGLALAVSSSRGRMPVGCRASRPADCSVCKDAHSELILSETQSMPAMRQNMLGLPCQLDDWLAAVLLLCCCLGDLLCHEPMIDSVLVCIYFVFVVVWVTSCAMNP
ncbi:hypothetical protein BS78_06G253500 [Paspalum vaginatum]|nr:hypothetical protein BS78_06G253500 [Paspalum vaginatum]